MPKPAFHRYAILPAAGRSVRMGSPKLLLPWGTGKVIDTVLSTWLASEVERVLIVLHPEDTELAAHCEAAGVQTVIAQAPPPDMRSSLCLGLSVLLAEVSLAAEDVVLVSPADIPEISAAIINLLIAEHQPQAPKILVPNHQGRRGHPVLLPAPSLQELFLLPADQGLNALLTPERVREIPCSKAGVPADIDTPDEYLRLKPDQKNT